MASGKVFANFCKVAIKLNVFTAFRCNCGLFVGKRFFNTYSQILQSAQQVTLVSPTKKPQKNSNLSYGPSVRLLLTLYDISDTSVSATGPHGRLLKGDVLNYISQNKLEPKPLETIALPEAPPSNQTKQSKDSTKVNTKTPVKKASSVQDEEVEYHDIPLTGMRKTIAKRLSLSKATIPHVYAAVDCSMTKLMVARKQLEKIGVKVSVNDFIIKACAKSLQKMPTVNAVWDGQEAKNLKSVDISVAVATDNGLITPIVTDVGSKSLAEISACVKDLGTRAREGKLNSEEFQGGSFTISNLGMFGVKEFSAVINPPQACILAVGGTQLVIGKEGKLETVMSITLSCDERIVSDEEAAQFAVLLKETLENPMTLGL